MLAIMYACHFTFMGKKSAGRYMCGNYGNAFKEHFFLIVVQIYFPTVELNE
jgi:hypothetical protein